MANPSSSHHERDRERAERHRSERSATHHHHRTISSTTLLLVLSLILAVLAVMLSLPSTQANAAQTEDAAAAGLWGILTPKRSQALVARESSVAMREAEVARREAELLIGAPGGVLPSQAPVACPPCPTLSSTTQIVDFPMPVQTIIKEVVKDSDLAPPGWWKEAGLRADELLERELRASERERDITRREDSLSRREQDASRRESWIMEQLMFLGSDSGTVEEEYVYEPAGAQKRKLKELPSYVYNEIPVNGFPGQGIPIHFNGIPVNGIPIIETTTVTHTQILPAETVTVPPPANTRFAAFPTPEVVSVAFNTPIPRTTAVQVVEEDFGPGIGFDEVFEEYLEEDGVKTVTVVRAGRQQRRPAQGWFGGW